MPPSVVGADFSSGSLGHGLSIGVGMALGGRMAGRDFHTYVMVGDGELAEGQIWEAVMAGAHFGLDRLVCIVDRNQLCIDGRTEDVMSVEPIHDRFASFGWSVQRIDGHDLAAVLAAFDRLDEVTGSPHVIVADTVKGKGVARMELDVDWHVGSLGPADYAAVEAELLGTVS
jgi:transketolase